MQSTPTPTMAAVPRKIRGPPAALRPLKIETPLQNQSIALIVGESSALSSATEDSDFSPFPAKARSLRNMKKLSLTLPSAQSSTTSLQLPSEPQSAVSSKSELHPIDRVRRTSVASLPAASVATTMLQRNVEGGSPSAPYVDGPIQIIPGIWLGSEDNARDWKGLVERGIKAILNVAKEVNSPFDSLPTQSMRPFSSTPNLKAQQDPTFHPAHVPSGRPSMHYLKLQWSHGQQDLVTRGFPDAMQFCDAALQRAEGVLIHCQCGISRSATMVIALVMRAAAENSRAVPPEVWALKGMQGAYSFVKEKSKWVGPNMSLIYQLLEYEKVLKGEITESPGASERSSTMADEEEEWGRRRREMEEQEDEYDHAVVREAQALDKAMEDRIVARKNSASSLTSLASSGVGMGVAWRSRYGGRKRAGSVASNLTNGSVISEDLVEEEEEQELLGIGGGFDTSRGNSPRERQGSNASNSPDENVVEISVPPPSRAVARAPPSAPAWKTSFSNIIPPGPATSTRSTFDLSSRPSLKPKRRPGPLGILPPVPSSPIAIIVDSPPSPPPARPRRVRTEKKPPPLAIRSGLKPISNRPPMSVSTPSQSQTLFVFPPSPTLTTRTPSTMTLTSNLHTAVPFPSLTTPRVSSFRSNGRTKSFIGLANIPPTPTTACSRVDARGWVGFE